MDWSLVITAALAVAAIISPIIVALLNNHHNFKIRKLELATDKKIESFENYTRSLAKYLEEPTPRERMVFRHNFNQAIIYVSPKTFKTMETINDLINNNNLDEIRENYLGKICSQLQKDLGIYKRRK